DHQVTCEDNDSLRRHDFLKRIPAVSGAAAHCENDPALVRRLRGSLEFGSAVLSAAAAAGLRLRALLRPLSTAESAGGDPRSAARRKLRAPADPAFRCLEAFRSR